MRGVDVPRREEFTTEDTERSWDQVLSLSSVPAMRGIGGRKNEGCGTA
jgi:hypothetical protein